MCISCLNLSSELQLCLSKSKILGHFLLEILEVNILTDAVYAGNFNGNDPLHHIRFMSSSQQPPATHPATHPPETHTVDEHVGLMGNWWDRPRETFPNHQLLNPNHIMGLWCGIKDSDCLGLFEGIGRLTLKFLKQSISNFWIPAIQEVKTQNLKAPWNFAICIGAWSRKGVPPSYVVFIFYKPISTIKPTYLTHLQTNLPAVIKHGNGHPPFSSLNIPLKHHDCKWFSHSHIIYRWFSH